MSRTRNIPRRRSPGYWITAGAALFLLLIAGALAWKLHASGPAEGLQALAEGRIATIEIQSGHIEGGLRPHAIEPPPEPPVAPENAQSPEAATPPADIVGLSPDAVPDSAAPADTTAPASQESLVAAPVAAVTEESEQGPLPAQGQNGEKPWQVYSRQDAAPPGTAVALLVTGLGLNRQVTEAALALPPQISLSFSPYAPDLALWVQAARARGHEAFVDLPLEPAGYPAVDPGPQALLAAATEAENDHRLRWALSRAPGWTGVYAPGQEHFTQEEQAARPVLKALADRGLLSVWGVSGVQPALEPLLKTVNLPYLQADARLDEEQTPGVLTSQLLSAEVLARTQKTALISCAATPLALKTVALWAAELEKKGIILAPVSALARAKFS